MESLFTVAQNNKLQQSVLPWVICTKSYPAKAFSTPVFSMPRPIPPFLIHIASDFIIASTRFSELELRRSADAWVGIRALATQFVHMWGDDMFGAWLCVCVDVEITPYMVDRLYAISRGA